jgi:CubicO group peptidase (beta-lactamase class C family)
MTRRPHLSAIATLGAACVATAAGAAPAAAQGTRPARVTADRPIVAGALGRRLDAHVARLVPFGFAGNVLVVKDGQTVLASGYGLANRERRIPFTARTIIPIGSIVKVFSNAAILALEADGKLRTTDSLGRFFPDLPADKAAITLHQLMTHSSGLPAFLGDDDEPMSRAEFMSRVRALPLAFAPGAGRSYSNVGYGVLAAVVEDLTRRDLEGYVRERFFLPAGMRETGWHYPRWDSTRLAHSYARGRDEGTELDIPHSEGPRPTWNVQGAGGWVSTPEDLYRWHLALAGDNLLRPAQKAKLHTSQTEPAPGRPTSGYQWIFSESPTRGRVMWAGGGNMIFEAILARYLDDGLVVVVSNNTGGQLSVPTAFDLGRLALGATLQAEPPAVNALPRAALERFAGTYALAGGAIITVTARDSGLALAPDGQAAFDALFLGNPATRARRDALAARTDSIVRASLAGDWRPFHRALGSQAPLDTVARRESAARAQLAGELGAPRGHRVVGVVPTAMGGHVIVRLEYERGGVYERYGWGPQQIGLFRRERSAPALSALPTGGDTFASFDPQRSAGVRLRFVPSAAGAMRLVVETPGGPVEATRHD